MLIERRHLVSCLLAASLPLPAMAQGRRGGDAVVAQQAEPPTLDAQITTARASRNITLHVYESLFTRDETAQPQPELAEGVDIAADGLSYRFFLRTGVTFHHGKPLTSADIAASMQRYARLGGSAELLKPVAAYETPDKKTFVMKLRSPFAGLIEAISSPCAPFVIMPEEECHRPPGRPNVIGTGPFGFVEHKPGSHAKLARFDGYRPNTACSGRDGFSGRKTAYFDSVIFRFMPADSARAAALQSGDVHVAETLEVPTASRLADDPALRTHAIMPWGFLTLVMNTGWGLTAKLEFRRAVQAALGREEIMAGATGGLYRLDPAWQYPGTAYYPGTDGLNAPPQPDEATARQWLRAAGYKGEELNLLADDTYPNAATVAAGQLRAAGINVKLIVPDRPGGGKPDGWNLRPLLLDIEPFEGPYNVLGRFGGRQTVQIRPDKGIEQCIQDLATQPEAAARVAAVAAFQRRLDDQAIAVKAGDAGTMQATRANLANFLPYRIPRMWDCWFA